MGLSELSAMYINGDISAREANELDGMDDDRMYCCNCQELFDEEDLYRCDNCGIDICDNCLTITEYGNYCSRECSEDDS